MQIYGAHDVPTTVQISDKVNNSMSCPTSCLQSTTSLSVDDSQVICVCESKHAGEGNGCGQVAILELLASTERQRICNWKCYWRWASPKDQLVFIQQPQTWWFRQPSLIVWLVSDWQLMQFQRLMAQATQRYMLTAAVSLSALYCWLESNKYCQMCMTAGVKRPQPVGATTGQPATADLLMSTCGQPAGLPQEMFTLSLICTVCHPASWHGLMDDLALMLYTAP